VVLIGGVGQVAVARGACTPLPPIVSCPTPPPSVPPYAAAPEVELAAVTSVTIDTATLNANVLPGYLPTTYYWLYGTKGELDQKTAVFPAPGDLTSVTAATELTGLQPETTYTAELVATNSDGTATSPQTPPFTTYERPKISISPVHRTISLGQNLDVRIVLRGRFDPSQYLKLYTAASPYHRYRLTGERLPTKRGSETMGLYASTDPLADPSDPDRNLRLRVEFDGRTSKSVLVYVDPVYSLTSTRDNGGASPYLTVSLSTNVHRVRGPYPRPLDFFYRSSFRNGPYSLFAVRRLKPSGESYFGEYLDASARLDSEGGVYVITCLRGPIFADMGKPFIDPECGRQTIPAG
jgi:hypothetical protein